MEGGKCGGAALYDVVIIGGGPAGLTAALYLARAKYRVLVLEKETLGGQITITHEVVNYPGIESISGKALTEAMHRQAEGFGAEFVMEKAERLELSGDLKTVFTAGGAYRCFGVLLATGAHPRTVGFQGEETYRGRGVAYCATCDGEFFTGREVFVVGGGYAAAEESVFLTRFARHVTVLVRKGEFSCAAAVADKAKHHEKITVLTHTELKEVSGENGIEAVRVQNTETGEETVYRAQPGDFFGVFVFAGYTPDTGLVEGLADTDESGYVRTDEAMKTSVDGLYAAGDVRIKPLRQVVTATGDGALAATELEKYAAEMQRKTMLRPTRPAPQAETAVSAAPLAEALPPEGEAALFSGEMQAQLKEVLANMAQPLCLKLFLDERPISRELETYMQALASLSGGKLAVETADRAASSEMAPCVNICLADGRETGLAFHGVPGGHEFTSFVLGLYNAAGPGQALDDETLRSIRALNTPAELKILVTLSCTLCPDLVRAAQRIAAENPKITAEVYDIQHFEALKTTYRVMSVPCLIINGKQVVFGKKTISQLLELLKQ